MKRLFVLIVGLVTLVAAALFLVLALGPRDEIVRSSTVTIDGRAVAEILAAREAAFDDITPGAEARVIWAGPPEVQTPLSILYLHGFSASSEEIRPVPDRVAEALGTNLIFARLTGHGRDGDALAAARAGDWVDDAALFIALARKAGERVLIMGTSAGGALAAYAATDPEMA
jgi:pimeloyl-ACP methyl ester carboxylesterase